MTYLEPFILHAVNRCTQQEVQAAALKYRVRIQQLLA
jgi:putative NADPH-quinone reductase